MLLNHQRPGAADPARAFLTSGQKAGLDATKLTLNFLHNFDLHRRDAFLDTTHRSLEASDKRRLRHHQLND